MKLNAGRALIGAGLVAVAATSGAAVEIAAAHKSAAPVRIQFVPIPESASYQIHVKSRVSACFRRAHVSLVRNRRVGFANFTNRRGVVVGVRDNRPVAFGPEFAGYRAVVARERGSRRGEHQHGCAGASRLFPSSG